MDWVAIWRQFIGTVVAAAIIAASNTWAIASSSSSSASSSSSSSGDCPEDYWDEPSKRCALPLVSALEKFTPDEDWASDFRVNGTCKLWVQTDACYQQLMRQCNGHINYVHELQQHLNRYWIYSLTCSQDQLKRRRSLVDCFVPHLKPTHSCTEAFEKYFRNFAADKQYRNACRVVSTAMKCFHEIKKQIRTKCPEDSPDKYQQLYISPLIEETGATVRTHCILSPPYDQYFSRAPTLTTATSYPTVVALLLVRWRR